MLRITELLSGDVSDPRLNVLKTGYSKDGVSISFTLRGDDGSLLQGERTFPLGAEFADVSDFMDELWAGTLYDVPGEPEIEPASLAWAIPIAGLALYLTVILHSLLTMSVRSSTLGITVAVCLTAIVLGAKHAIAVAALCAIGWNLLSFVPNLVMELPDVEEYVRTAVWISLALVVPWLVQNRHHLNAKLSLLEAQLSCMVRSIRET